MKFRGVGLLRLTLMILCGFGLQTVWSTFRYYNSYVTYGTGDTMISTFHFHSGPSDGAHKWNVECLDGEALIGIGDSVNDFARVDQVWCKFMFPYKPPAQKYPYYSGCHVRNFTTHFFCFDPNNAERTLGSFITGLWANNFHFHFSDLPGNNVSLMKCCNVPTGYYIDYTSCLYVSTHDQYFEYYDNPQQLIVYCSTGYVATGIAKKMSPYSANSLNPFSVDWLQCCRLGFGPHLSYPPPVTYAPSGAATYYSTRTLTAEQISVPAAYRHQYKGKEASGQVEARIHGENDREYFGYMDLENGNAANSSVPMNRQFTGQIARITKKQPEDMFDMGRKLRIRSSQLIEQDRRHSPFRHNTMQ